MSTFSRCADDVLFPTLLSAFCSWLLDGDRRDLRVLSRSFPTRRSSDLYGARDVNTRYRAAQDRLDRKQYGLAAALFDEVERQHPYSPWARRAQLMSAFSYYMDRESTPAIEAAQRFLEIHPGNKDEPNTFSLLDISSYEQIIDVTHAQQITHKAPD